MDYEKALLRAREFYTARFATDSEKEMLEQIFPKITDLWKSSNKEDCIWCKNGECTKALPGTDCDIVGCVAYTTISPNTSGIVIGDTSELDIKRPQLTYESRRQSNHLR